MNKNKLVLKYCPNFQRIIDMDFQDGDNISMKLVDIYEDFIFKANVENSEDVKLVKQFDKVVASYIDDYEFRKEIQDKLYKVKVKKNVADILKAIVEAIIGIFDVYLEETTRKIYIARWI